MTAATSAEPVRPVRIWRRVTAAMLDFWTIFFAGGYAIAAMTGNLTSHGFELNGPPAVALFGLIAAYFIILRKWGGGTLWDRAFGIKRPQPY